MTELDPTYATVIPSRFAAGLNAIVSAPRSTIAGRVASETDWNRRIALIRTVPEEFGKAQHQAIYASVAEAAYVSDLAPNFAYVHWRVEYELSRNSQLDQRKRGPLEIEGVNGLMDCGIEGIGVGEGLMREMMRLEVAPDGFDVV